MGSSSDSSGLQTNLALVGLVCLAVAVPAIAFLWSVTRALENDSAASAQRVEELSELQMAEAKRAVARRVVRYSRGATKTFEKSATLEPGDGFRWLVKRQIAPSVLMFDADGELSYPILADYSSAGEPTPADLEAREVLATLHDRIASGQPFVKSTSRALKNFQAPEKRSARDASGRAIWPNLVLSLAGSDDITDERRTQLLGQLKRAVNSYTNVSLPSSQRLFLATRLAALDPEFTFQTHEAELLADLALQAPPELPESGVVTLLSRDADLWGILHEDRRVMQIFHGENLRNEFDRVIAEELEGGMLRVGIAPASLEEHSGLLAEAGARLPGWELRGELLAGAEQNAVGRSRRNLYITIAAIALVLAGVLGVLAVRRTIEQSRVTRLRNDFLSTVSHELRTPLTSLRMLVDTLATGHYKDPERTKKYLDVMAQENERLSHLVETFLAFSRMERGKVQFDRQAVAPTEIIERARVAVADRFAASGVDFHVDVQEDLPTVDADTETMATALINLLDNAYKYSGSEKQIHLGVRTTDGGVQFYVNDNGEGISDRDKKRVLERFYRADTDLARASGGSGIGLSIVRFIVEGHTGSLEIGGAPGKGSQFKINLPSTTP